MPGYGPPVRRFFLLLPLAACKEPILQVIPGVTSAVEVVVQNPTECPTCDAFEGIDTLRVDVLRGEDVIATDSFAWPGDEVVLPDLTDFGVVRVALVGLFEGRVMSAGRTRELVVPADETVSVPLVFLPANRANPLAAPMITPRSRHNTIVRRDGTVLLMGGLDRAQTRAINGVELYDPASGTFAEWGTLPTASVADQVAAPLPEGATILVGGLAVVGETQVNVEVTTIFDDAVGTFTAAGALNEGRSGHCVAMFRERQGLVLGGGGDAADYLRPDESGTWSFSSLPMRDFDASLVTGCAPLSDETVYVQGSDPTNTGVWAGGADGADPGEAFTSVAGGGAGDVRFVSGAAMVPTADGAVYVIGGADVTTGEVFADGRLFSAGSGRFSPITGFRRPRYDTDLVPWIEEGWYAAGCSWADATHTEEEPSVELVSPTLDEGSPLFSLDRVRPGCALTVLGDGSLLVTGGGEPNATGDDAALIVPWVEAPPE
jgi:hypothetical protein